MRKINLYSKNTSTDRYDNEVSVSYGERDGKNVIDKAYKLNLARIKMFN